MALVRPAALAAGDTVSVVSPSSGAASAFPWLLERAERNLKVHLGLSIKELPHTRSKPKFLERHPEARAADLEQAFEDPETTAVFATIGGDDSVRVLPHLDRSLFRKHPKILMGFSDTSTLTTWGNLQGLVTFNGPSLLAGWAQMEKFPPPFLDLTRSLLFDAASPIELYPFAHYSEGYPDWSVKTNLGKVNQLSENEGPHWVRGKQAFEGPLFGGCLEVLEFLKGTEFWPEKDFWKGKVLFLETSEEVPSLKEVRRWLRNYGVQGVFDQVAGLLFGRARGYTPQQKTELDSTILEVLTNEFHQGDLPVVTNLDFGHTDPQWILPLGVKLSVDPRLRRFVLTEPATRRTR
ncbi:MAG: LD-carboxypeptidase [Candidatus Thermoplasmatota archaeon]|nr:LD-carboxypeptidase [Candidatus Thermoplasmatota archaeon]